jgi:META domain
VSRHEDIGAERFDGVERAEPVEPVPVVDEQELIGEVELAQIDDAILRNEGLAIIVAAAATACTDNSLTPSDMIGGTWQLVSIQRNGTDPINVADASRYTLQLDSDGRVRVKSDCNSCGGS